MLDYIVNYQNNFVSSYLFKFNFAKILEKGLPLHDLLASDVFTIKIIYDEWPDNHINDKKMVKTYHGSFFDLRKNYASIFPELAKEIDTPKT